VGARAVKESSVTSVQFDPQVNEPTAIKPVLTLGDARCWTFCPVTPSVPDFGKRAGTLVGVRLRPTGVELRGVEGSGALFLWGG
jgi:hypothetical protein